MSRVPSHSRGRLTADCDFPLALAAWEKLSYTNRKEMARGLEEAKTRETRERRLAAALERLRG